MLWLIFQERANNIFLALQFVAASHSFNSSQFVVSAATAILFHLDEQISCTAPWKVLPQVFRKELARIMLQFIFPLGKHKIGTVQN